ncbi:MAG: hypothetical protein A2Y10_20005 [Planctomycetes bacterium GWF2_41_51]|nr:MAG: hypothetical protein A2Y10_20005 [Planctomycetes bacterium GWF2_41_51]HBG28572.1 hypothetical protein [Phycisphaerales bacterium]
MNSRKIIKAVINFKNPPRIGMVLPEPYPNDFLIGRRTESNPQILPPERSELRRWKDEWGVTWASLTEFDKGEVVLGAINDWKNLKHYYPPDLGKKSDYAEATKLFAETQKFRIGFIPGFTFSVARKLRKLEDYLCDVVLERQKIDKLHNLIRNELLKAIDSFSEAGADAIMFCEDWGTQNQLFVSPDMWREIFRPEFQILAGRIHDHGMNVIMHSCGKITSIIGDLIQCGIDCLQFDQPRLHGIEILSENYGGKVTFWCPVDVQKTLPTQDSELITNEAKFLIEKFGSFGGGFIAGYYTNNEAIGITPDIQKIASESFLKFGCSGNFK